MVVTIIISKGIIKVRIITEVDIKIINNTILDTTMVREAEEVTTTVRGVTSLKEGEAAIEVDRKLVL